jgi:RNA polymerase sigma-70 factor (ECF subfamily)
LDAETSVLAFFEFMKSGLLVAAFKAELAAVGKESLTGQASDDDALELSLVQACGRGRAAFPSLPLEDQTFVRYLARLVAASAPPAEPVFSLPMEDLYLACACLAGTEGAVAVFRARHGATIRGAIGRVVVPSEVGEAEQQLLQSLLVGSEGTPPKLSSYAGRAPLDRWLGVAAQRAALMSLRGSKAEARARQAAAVEPGASGHAGPESIYMKERYRGDFEQALVEALGRLSERDRVLLRLQLVNGVTVEKIGTMYSVSQPTASRWLAAAREKLLDDVKRALGARLGTSSTELASLAGMVASRLDLSLSVLLKTG